eukprot:gene29004-36045_t
MIELSVKDDSTQSLRSRATSSFQMTENPARNLVKSEPEIFFPTRYERTLSTRTVSFLKSTVGFNADSFPYLTETLCVALVGIFTGLLAHMSHLFVNLLALWKMDATYYYIDKGNFAAGWAVYSAIACGCVLVSVACVLLEPTARSSGIPGILALLNGTEMSKVVAFKSLVATSIGTVFSVASGLAVGPEGPLIHIGACIGRQALRLFYNTRSLPRDTIYSFVAVGAGA